MTWVQRMNWFGYHSVECPGWVRCTLSLNVRLFMFGAGVLSMVQLIAHFGLGTDQRRLQRWPVAMGTEVVGEKWGSSQGKANVRLLLSLFTLFVVSCCWHAPSIQFWACIVWGSRSKQWCHSDYWEGQQHSGECVSVVSMLVLVTACL